MRFSAKAKALYKWLRVYKGSHPCPCGEDDYRCLEFHHLKPKNKSFSIADGVRRGYTKTKLRAEMKKCQVLCKNCHVKVTLRKYED